MAEPTLKDVLDAIAKLATRDELAATRDELAATRDELTATRDELAAGLAKLEVKMEKRFDTLDDELTKHADVHRELEKDIETIKRRPPRTAARPTRRR